VYRWGKENVAVDALSRIPHMMNIQACSKVKPVWIQEVVNSYATGPHAQQLLTQLALASPNEQGYQVHQGIIRLGSQVWIGDNFALKTKLIHAFHSTRRTFRCTGDICEDQEAFCVERHER
jgi:hypothetical protein